MAGTGSDTGSLTARSMPAAVACFFGGLTGSAAAGISEFQGGRAGIPVAGGAREILVLLATGAGVQSGGFGLVIGFHGIVGRWLCIFRHLFTNRTVIVR
jgi:hypothetical protein